MTRKLINNTSVSVKDDNGLYVKSVEPRVSNEDLNVSPDEVSIDTLLKDGLLAIHIIIKKVVVESKKEGIPEREYVQTLKDCMTMLHELKKKEQELLETITVEELEKLLAKHDNK